VKKVRETPQLKNVTDLDEGNSPSVDYRVILR
jgi:hypothetical protein